MTEPIELEINYPEARVLLRVREGGTERVHTLSERGYERTKDAAAVLLDPVLKPGQVVRRLRASPGAPALRLGLERSEVELSGEALADAPARAWAGLWGVALSEAGYAEAARDAGALMSEREFWGSRYRAGDTMWDLGAASPPLVRALGALPPGRAVVVGCGRGHEVQALARLGFEVVGVDFAPEAIADARAGAEAAGLKARFVQQDMFQLPADLGTFDYWVEHTCFCAIDPHRRAEYVAAAQRTIKPGGLLVGLFYAHGRPGGPPYATTEAEVRAMFGAAFEVEELAVAPDSIERRQGQELLGRLRRR